MLSRSLALLPLLSLLAVPASALSIYRPPIGSGTGYGGVIWVDPNPPPAKPAYPGVSLTFSGGTQAAPRTTSMALHIGWRNVSNAATATVTRTSPGSTTIATLTNVVANTDSSVIDAHPVVDALNCYRIAVADAQNRVAYSDYVCMITPDGQNRPLWRAQLEVDVANVSDAGTDNDVNVRLDSPAGLYGYTFSPSGNNTWIDTPSDDLEQGSNRTYELEITSLTGGLPLGSKADVSDVKMVTLNVNGDGDAMCVQGLNLVLNGQSMFRKTFSQCVWVTPAAPLTVDTAELRSSPAWHASVPSQPLGVPYEMLDSLGSLAVAQQLHGTDASWRDTYFSSNPETSNYGNFIRNYEWAVDYDGLPLNLQASFAIENTCVNNKAFSRLYIEDVDVDAASYLELLAPLTEALVNAFAPDFPNLFDKNLALGVNCQPGSLNIGLCFDNNGINLCAATF